MSEGIPVKRLTPKIYLESFLDASESHKTSANLSVRAYFQQFSNWYETYSGHSQESPGMLTFASSSQIINEYNTIMNVYGIFGL